MKAIYRKLILATLTGFLLASFINMIPAELYAKCGIPDPKEPTICHDEFFGSNDIIFYDPNATDCSVLTADGNNLTLVGNENGEKIFTFLIGKGLTAEQAAGILGNLQEESGFDPAIIQGIDGINGGKPRIATADYKTEIDIGFGLAQWTFRSRQLALEAFASSTNRTIIDLSMQVDFLWQEFSSSPALASLKNQTTPETAARDFHITYERSRDDAAKIEERAAAARELFEKYKSLAPTSSIATSTNAGGCPASPGSGTGLTEFMSDSFHIYNQCNYPPYGGPWGDLLTPYGQTMCSAACGPTSLAMIAKNMTGANISPAETINYYTEKGHWYPGGGSLISALSVSAGDFGLNVSTIANKGDLYAYKEVFDRGGLVSVSARGTSPFLSQGHTIVLRGITAENKFMIADPGYRETNIAPANQISVDKILTDIRSDSSSQSFAYYKK
jgi:hypothetical protein